MAQSKSFLREVVRLRSFLALLTLIVGLLGQSSFAQSALQPIPWQAPQREATEAQGVNRTELNPAHAAGVELQVKTNPGGRSLTAEVESLLFPEGSGGGTEATESSEGVN